MKAVVIYVSKSGNSALLSIKSEFGIVHNQLVGWTGLNETNSVAKGDEIEVPAKSVSLKEEVTKDGTVFNKLVFS